MLLDWQPSDVRLGEDLKDRVILSRSGREKFCRSDPRLCPDICTLSVGGCAELFYRCSTLIAVGGGGRECDIIGGGL